MKKNITSLVIFLLGISLGIQAQTDISLPGLVVKQNSKQKTGQVEYISNVSVKATQASPTSTDLNGQFTLVFADKPAYNVTRIFVEKSGMEVVNKTDLERATILGRLDKLKIVMCTQGELRENQMLYYGIAEKHIVGRFKKRIAALEAANTGLDKTIAEINAEFNLELKTKNEAIYALEKEWSKALTSAQETAQKFAAINLDDADPLYLQADEAYKKGDFDKVLQLLQYELLEKNIRNIQSNLSAADSLSKEGQSRIARGMENLKQTIENALFGARVAKLNGAWKRAEEYYDLAVRGDEGNTGVMFEAATYMHIQKQFSKARTYYEKALANTDNPIEKGNILNNLGILLKDNNEMSEAKKAFEEALQIRRQLADITHGENLPSLAMTLTNLGIFLSHNNDKSGAKQAFEEALQINRKLAEDKTDENLIDLAISLANFGEFLVDNDNINDARKAYEEALLIVRQLTKKNPEDYLPYMAKLLTNLGVVLEDSNEITMAEQTYEEALQIYRKLAKENPDTYLPDLAMTLNNLGIMYKKENNNIAMAKINIEEALQINRQLAGKNPHAYMLYVAVNLNSLGGLLYATNDLDSAKIAFEETLQIYRKLAEKNPDAYLQDVATTLTNLGVVLSAYNEINGAKQAYEEALEIYRKLTEKKLYVYQFDVAGTLNNLGNLLRANNEMEAAKQAYEEALEIYMELSEKSPNIYLPYKAKTLNNLGDLLWANNEMEGAKKAVEEVLQIYRKLAVQNPTVYLPDLAMTLNHLGALFHANNDMSGAKQTFEEALQIIRKLAEENPQAYNLDVAMTDVNVGLFYEQLLRIMGDMTLKTQGLELMKDAEQRLAIFPKDHPRVQQYQPYIKQLTQFFQDFDISSFQLEQQVEQIYVLINENKTEKDPHEKVLRQEKILGILFNIEKTTPDDEELTNMIAIGYVSLAWYQLFDYQFSAAETSARAGLAKDPKEEWINTKLALALLYQGKWEDAQQIYENLKDKPYYSKGTYKATFLEDLDTLEKEGITHPDVAKARNLLGKK